MNTIDCLGDMCPIPVLKLKKALKKAKPNSPIKIITDHSCVAESIKTHFTRKDISLEFDEVMNGVWEIIITKL
ncbi:MAG: sulfurtransferase TusA family protein [Clostridium sp.]|uniref:sulfurtransferase TusA family protein n=1 Tax=Clostridium sp. TaxID=1506 RepID=UPI003D6D29AC